MTGIEPPALTIQAFDQDGLAMARRMLAKFRDQNLNLADAHGLAVTRDRKSSSCWSTDRHGRENILKQQAGAPRAGFASGFAEFPCRAAPGLVKLVGALEVHPVQKGPSDTNPAN